REAVGRRQASRDPRYAPNDRSAYRRDERTGWRRLGDDCSHSCPRRAGEDRLPPTGRSRRSAERDFAITGRFVESAKICFASSILMRPPLPRPSRFGCIDSKLAPRLQGPYQARRSTEPYLKVTFVRVMRVTLGKDFFELGSLIRRLSFRFRDME